MTTKETKFIKITQVFEKAFTDSLCEDITTYVDNSNLKPIESGVQDGVLGVDIMESSLRKTITDLGFDFANEYFSKFGGFDYDLKIEAIEVLRYPDGTFCNTHTDKELITDNERQDITKLMLSMILFLNDDYDGGELTFKDQNLVVNPQKGKLVVFPCSFLVPHAVSRVCGTRDVLGINFAI